MALIHEGQLLLYEEKDQQRERYGLYACTPQQAAQIDSAAIVARRENAYGLQLLVKRDLLPPGLLIDRPSLEDIMLMLIKEEKSHEGDLV